MSRIATVATPWLAAVCLVLLSGCSNSLQQNYMRDKAAEHTYSKPLAELWPQVKDVMKSRGYSWREIPGRYVLETEWFDAGGTMGRTTTSKYLVEGFIMSTGGSRLRVLRSDAFTQATGVAYVGGSGGSANSALSDEMSAQVTSRNPTSGSLPTEKRAFRDLEMELQILKYADPTEAEKLVAEYKKAHP